jgi:hypothetical protein
MIARNMLENMDGYRWVAVLMGPAPDRKAEAESRAKAAKSEGEGESGANAEGGAIVS